MTSAGSTIPQALQALADETVSGFTFESLGGSRFLSFAQPAAGAASRRWAVDARQASP